MSMVHASGGLVTPPSPHLKSEVAIVCGMGARYLARERDRLGRVRSQLRPDPRQDRGGVPEAVRRFHARIRVPGGFHLTNGPRERVWKTATGRANFLVCPGVAEDPAVANPAMLRLATIRKP